MSSQLDALLRACPPPDPGVDWQAIEAELGVKLPTIYKRLCDAYGDHPIGEFTLFTPQARSRKGRFPEAALADAAGCRSSRDDQDDDFTPIPDYRGWRFFPELPGLLPWAVDGSMSIFFEVDPAVDPDSWRLVVREMHVGGHTSNLAVSEDRDPAAFLLRALEEDRAGSWSPETLAAAEAGDVEHIWTRLRIALDAAHWEALIVLRPGATEDEIAAAEAELGVRLPEPFRQSVLCHDGQDAFGPWLVDGGLLCSLELLLEEWRGWMEMLEAGDLDQYAVDAEPDRGIRDDQWWRRGWLPFVSRDGDYLVLDLDPADGGQMGQVFAFSRAHGAGRLAAPDFATWLNAWAQDLEAGVVMPREGGADEDAENEAEELEDDDELEEDDDGEDEDWTPVSSKTWPI